jgi:hypothetical protein
MPSTSQKTVTTTAAIVVPAQIGDQSVYLHSSSGTIYIGGADLTTANGYVVDHKDKLTVQVGDHEGLYGVVNSGTTTVSVLYQVN